MRLGKWQREGVDSIHSKKGDQGHGFRKEKTLRLANRSRAAPGLEGTRRRGRREPRGREQAVVGGSADPPVWQRGGDPTSGTAGRWQSCRAAACVGSHGESEREEILVSACVGLLFLFKCRGVLGLVEHHLVFKSWSQRG